MSGGEEHFEMPARILLGSDRHVSKCVYYGIVLLVIVFTQLFVLRVARDVS
jgi:hypothetical protein